MLLKLSPLKGTAASAPVRWGAAAVSMRVFTAVNTQEAVRGSLPATFPAVAALRWSRYDRTGINVRITFSSVLPPGEISGNRSPPDPPGEPLFGSDQRFLGSYRDRGSAKNDFFGLGNRIFVGDITSFAQQIHHDLVGNAHDGILLDVVFFDLRRGVVCQDSEAGLDPGDVLRRGIDEQVDVLRAR